MGKYFVYKENKKEFIKILYSHDYKHGFDLKLKDEIFTKYYRRITGLFHITVNFRRIKVIKKHEKNEQNEIEKDLNKVIMAPQKQLNDLNKEQFCFVLDYFLKQQNIDIDTMKLKNCIITDMRLDGNAFSQISRKNFGKGIKKIGVATGKASKLYKSINDELNPQKIAEILAHFKPVQVPQNVVMQKKEIKKEKEEEEEKKVDVVVPVKKKEIIKKEEIKINKDKELNELNLDEMFMVILHCMDEIKLVSDYD